MQSDEEMVVVVTREIHNKGAPKVQHGGCKVGRVDTSANYKLSGKQNPKTKAEKAQMMTVPYALAIGSLMYAMVCTQSDIEYAIGVVSRFMTNPRREHWATVKWILWYLKGISRCASDSAKVNPSWKTLRIQTCLLM